LKKTLLVGYLLKKQHKKLEKKPQPKVVKNYRKKNQLLAQALEKQYLRRLKQVKNNLPVILHCNEKALTYQHLEV
jgi:hypothetical protein